MRVHSKGKEPYPGGPVDTAGTGAAARPPSAETPRLQAANQLGQLAALPSPCDTPFLPTNLVDRLLAVTRDSDARVIRVANPGQVHYTVMLFHRSLLPDLAEYLADGGRQVQSWQARHACREALFDDTRAFLNINTPEDLQQAERLAGNPSG